MWSKLCHILKYMLETIILSQKTTMEKTIKRDLDMADDEGCRGIVSH